MSESPQSQIKFNQSEVLLRQIRNLLANEHVRPSMQDCNVSSEEAEQYLEQSYKRIFATKQFQQKANSCDPYLYYSKITEAGRLIQNENPMIKKYIQNKIQSQLFRSHNQTIVQSVQMSDEDPQIKYTEEYQYLLGIKKQLAQKYLMQKLNRQKNVSEMIDKTKKYMSYDNVLDRIPLMKIQSLVSREGFDVDSILQKQSMVSSQNNLIKFTNTDNNQNIKNNRRNKSPRKRQAKNNKNQSQFVLSGNQQRQYYQQGEGQQLTRKMKQLLNRKGQKQQPIQIQFEEDQSGQMKTTNKLKAGKMNSLLVRSPIFMQCFKGFLQQIIQANDDIISLSDKNKQFSFDGKDRINEEKKKRFTYPARQDQGARKLNAFLKNVVDNANTNVSSLSIQYKTKGLSLLPKQPIEQSANRSNIFLMGSSTGKIKKVVSKRIGETFKYHLKQCIVSGNYLYYSDQQPDANPGKSNSSFNFISSILQLQKMKKVQITLQPLQIIMSKKQQGNIFQGKQSEVEIIAVRSPQRNFYFQRNYAEGVELAQLLVLLKLRRFHKMNSLLAARANSNMENFIQGDNGVLDFSHQYLRPYQQYQKSSYRKNFLLMFISLFPKRKNTTDLQFQNCKLGLSELRQVLSECSLYFTKILHMNFSRTKLDTAALGDIIRLIKKCSNSTALQLNLSSCQINDDILSSNMAVLSTVVNKIRSLNLSKNVEISDKGVEQLASCLSSKLSQIQELDLSETGIQHFLSIANILKNCPKLQKIKVNNCGLRCQDLSTIKQQFNKYIQKGGVASNNKILIQMKNNQAIKSIKDIDLLLNSGIHEFQLDFDLSILTQTKNKSQGLISKHVCVEFVL